MHIKTAAEQTGLSTKAIRYYETISLVKPLRDNSGYRVYADSDVEKLRFVARSRDLGFSIEDCKDLLELYQSPTRKSANVKAIATHHLMEIKRKRAELAEMENTLEKLVNCCPGNENSDCAIINGLAKPNALAALKQI